MPDDVERGLMRVMNTTNGGGKPDDLDALLSLGDVRPEEILALVPSLVSAAGDVPPEARALLARLAKAAGVRDDDDDATVARKLKAFSAANAPRDDVKRGLFTLAAGRALDLVKTGAAAAFAKFNDETPNACPVGNHSDGKGVSPLALRMNAPATAKKES